jgi:hypothetical protein
MKIRFTSEITVNPIQKMGGDMSIALAAVEGEQE